ncbi:5-formyltetrahydrofolate cyclo-ligase [Rhodobacter sp. KR11]|uniref:5-formyltetrahydrofolate cyclo-ligase n=1 Tax=Rhodobacter sp. KR11 TaxID=2974588 RepID=UPI00222252A8|nr:5-formyltetrahydrofolate cyclo-ligase [Rhodobacter sp. KR11]MCW1917372.1 5-formyltetrahydrofolate cyclo-ligase [Rhodobacter sp. KR11]
MDEIKAAARKDAFARRKEAYSRGQGQAAELLADVLAEFGTLTLSGYMPMRTEIDPLPAMARHRGPVGVPVILAPATPLRFRLWTPDATMVTGDFGALIPADGPWIEPQVMIAPLLSFDARGYRLGYGGGFYDRTVQALRARHKVTVIGFAFAAQEVDEVPIDQHDEKLDAIVTEAGVRWF